MLEHLLALVYRIGGIEVVGHIKVYLPLAVAHGLLERHLFVAAHDEVLHARIFQFFLSQHC